MKLANRLISFLFFGAALVHAASPTWDAVVQVPHGTNVEVIHSGMKRASGTLVAASDEGITVQTDAGPNAILRSEVRRVSIAKRSRKSRALIGALIGAGAGAAAAAIGASSGDIDIRRDLVVGSGAAVGALAGAAFGAASGGPETIYRAP